MKHATKESPMKPNFVTVVHKVIRAEMFDVSLALSSCDPADDDAVAAAISRLERVAGLLRTHGEREDEGFLPLLRDKHPEAAARLERDHVALERKLAGVCGGAAAARGIDPAQRASALLLTYLDWNAFLAAYFEHLDDEELRLFPLLGDAIPGVEVMAGAAVTLPPEARAGFEATLRKALTPGERTRIEAALATQEKTAAAA